MTRRGVTLIETLLMTALGLGLMGFAYNMMRKSASLTDAASHTIDLQVGVRNLLENMVRDVAACQQILNPGAQPSRTLMMVKPFNDEIEKRLQLNADKAFPFISTAQPTTRQQMEALRITYTWDPAVKNKPVRRKEELGTFIAESTQASPAVLSQFTFQNPTVVSDRELAGSVETFAITYVGYDPITGHLIPIVPPAYEKTACLAVRINSQFDEGLYQGRSNMPKIEIMTKIWSMKRRSDEMYKEYFSSTDEDLRW
jgi:hypothetical protein